MKTKIFATLLIVVPFLAHAQAPVTLDQPCMAKMGDHHANPGAPARHHGAGHEPMPPFLHGLNLSEAQQDKVFELMHQQAPLLRNKGKASHKAMDELRQLALTEQYDEPRAKTLARTAAETQSEMALLRVQNDQKIYALLTPEQRKKLAAQIAGKADLPLPR